MALINFWPQKNCISGLNADLSGLTAYAHALNSCAAEINACWSGNTDKQYIFSAIGRQMQAVNRLRQEVNWVRQTSDFVLVKVNELGRLEGFTQPYVAQIASIGLMCGCSTQTRIKLDTGKVRAVATTLNNKRSSLVDSKGNLFKARSIIDMFILGIWGIGGRLNSVNSKMDELIARHDRIVNALNKCAEIYDAADRRLVQRAGGHSASSAFGFAGGGGFSGEVSSTDKTTSRILEIISKLMDIASNKKATDNKELALAGGLFGYAKSLFDFYSGNKAGLTGYQNLLGIGKSSSSVYSAIYKYVEKSVDVYTGRNLSATWGFGVSGLSMVGKAIGFSKDTLSYTQVLSEYLAGKKTVYDALSSYVTAVGGGVQFAGSASIFYNYAPKTIQLVMGKGGSLSSGLVTKSSLSKVSSNLYAIGALFSMASTGIKSYGTYQTDGKVTADGASHICLETGMSGINALLLGLIGEDNAKKMADAVYNGTNAWSYKAVDIYSNSPDAMAAYESGGTMRKIGIQVTAYTYAAVDTIKDAASSAGKAIQSGVSSVTSKLKGIFGW